MNRKKRRTDRKQQKKYEKRARKFANNTARFLEPDPANTRQYVSWVKANVKASDWVIQEDDDWCVNAYVLTILFRHETDLAAFNKQFELGEQLK